MANRKEKYQTSFEAALFRLTLDRAAAQPLHLQLVEALRQVILSAPETEGSRLPGGRMLAQELSVSRITVGAAYDQLISEGYLVARRGSGTFVADHLPHLATPKPRPVSTAPKPQPWLPFQTGLPDGALFPHRAWARHLERAWRRPEAGLLARPDPFGWYPLRQSICDHLAAWRGLVCAPEQVLITAGASEGIGIMCGALLETGQTVVLEDPGWGPLRGVLDKAGLRAVPQRIDAEGIDAADLPRGAAAVIVTPSRHFPTGRVMPLARRLALLDYAAAQGALVVEDDYDSEFRYIGQPLPALSGLDGLKTTLYLGSFSKLLSPALRLGYMVLPERLVPQVRDHIGRYLPQASLVPQPALAALMQSGDFAIHLRRMRRTYAKRQAVLVAALAPVAGLLAVRPDPSGMHLCCELQAPLVERTTDAAICAQAARRNLQVRALSAHAVRPDPPQGLLLGYAGFAEPVLEAAAGRLTDLVLDMAG